MRWYHEPIHTTGKHVLDVFIIDVTSALLTQIIERRCPWCERLAGYAHADWTAPALMFPPCGRIECLLATLRTRGRLWGWTGHTSST